MNTESGARQEKPLSGSSKFALSCGAGLTILLSYLVATVFVVILLVVIGFEFLLILGLARFGLARLITGAVGTHINLLTVFFRSFWLRKGVEFRIPLSPAEAPALFEILNVLCQRAGVQIPHEVQIEMTVSAWVKLKGYRRGAGRTILGIGYDLLAGLSKWEMEGVLAHEITHAKLIQRGYKNWLNRGLGRMGQLARGLHWHVEAYRKANRLIEPAPMFFRSVDALMRLAARLVAGCSRQDEFDADRGAATLCGAAAIRSSLLKLDPLGQHASRLPWNERIARLQSGEGFSQWLVGELTSVNFERQGKREQNLFFQYSTHPSLLDRLAALPSDSSDAPKDSPPAITLLKDPDAVAETLISEIQKRAVEEERKDSKRLKRFTRSTGINATLRPLQSFGAFVVIIGAIGGIAAILVDGFSPGSIGFLLGVTATGMVLFRLGRYRERLTLAVPEYSVLKKAWQKPLKFTDEEVKAMESELRAQVSAAGAKRNREMAFASLSYDALKRCDYVRAHIAARFCLEVNNKSIEGAVGLAVAAAALRQVQQSHQALNYLRKMTGMATPGILWSAAWTLVTCGDWVPAEAFLEKLCQSKKRHPTHLFLLALCQSKRGKMQSSLLTARLACTPAPANNEQAKFLIDLLLQAGYLREAESRLKLLEAEALDDIEIMLLMVRLNLLLRNFAVADKWSEQMRGKQAGAHYFVRLGQYHEVARQNQKASGFYGEALAAGFYPESLLGLARIEALDRNKRQARKYLMDALNTGRELGERAVGPLPLFHEIIDQMLALEDPVSNCRAWIVSLNGGKSPPGLANRALLIYANRREQAEQYFKELVSAMEPGMPPIFPSHLGWKEAEKERQPDGPVRAGIQCVLN